MNFEERRTDIFKVSKEYHLAHCISSDCAMGAGIAVKFQREFYLRNKLLALSKEERSYPTCIKVVTVFNLITKSKYYEKPTYYTVQESLIKMREQAIESGITKIAMPKIASGLDRLSWVRIRELIIEVFKDTDINILVCLF